VEAFYQANRQNFRKPELFRAAHVVKHVGQGRSPEEARVVIEAALAELERGVPFAEVAVRHSDCKDKDGDLGQFPAGYMVEEFEEAIRALEPGQRSDVFTTPFGFHIAQLHSITAAGPATFEEARGHRACAQLRRRA
jgi:parvulin-like peptidyl-prolyl isomerase